MSTFSPLVLALALSSLSLAAPASASEMSTAAADGPHVCDGVFEAPVSADVALTTNPPARSDARPGDVLSIDATWSPDGWESLSSAAACVKVSGTLDPALSKVESPGPGAGAAHHSFTIADGYFAGTAICTRYRLAGDPVGHETAATRVSKQSCVEVHPEEDEQNHTTPTTAPTTVPTTAPATVVTSPPATSPATTPTKPAEAPGPIDEQSAGTPTGPAVAVDRPTVESTSTRPPTRPIVLPELPRTGTAGAQLSLYGAATATAGLFALAAARLIPRRRRTQP